MVQLENLRKLKMDAEAVVAEKCKGWEMILDGANFQTKSKADFDTTAKSFQEEGLRLSSTLSHSGRRINVYRIPEELRPRFMGLVTLELSEPKPGKKIEKTEWEYISYVVPEYDQFLEKGCADPGDLKKVRVIGDSKFCYYAPFDNRIQFRNKSIALADDVPEEAQAPEAPAAEGSGLDLQSEVEKEKEMRLKLMADFENFRKLSQRQIESVQELASKDLSLRLLEILDDLERAIEKSTEDGIKNIYEKLLKLLEHEGYEVIAVKPGDKFDHLKMEAISTTKTTDGSQDNTVEQVVQNGFVHTNSGQVLRPARVIVAKVSA